MATFKRMIAEMNRLTAELEAAKKVEMRELVESDYDEGFPPCYPCALCPLDNACSDEDSGICTTHAKQLRIFTDSEGKRHVMLELGEME